LQLFISALSASSAVNFKMTIHQAILYGERLLRDNGVEQPRWNAEQLVILALQQPRSRIYSELTRDLSDAESDSFRRLLRKRSDHYPLAYIEGKQEFFGQEFAVGEEVLIPRPETEEIIHAVLALPLPESPRLLDLGSGSGNIAVTLAVQIPGSTAIAVEKSEGAIRILRMNLQGNTIPVRADLSCCPFQDGSFDVITSNPPYVEPEEFQRLPAETRWEPTQALITENLEETYTGILSQSLRLLKPGGFLVFEIGFGQIDRIQALYGRFREFRLLEIRNDYREIPRTVVLQKQAFSNAEIAEGERRTLK
jgi:release factor glutamine methyltransferase